MFLGIRRDDRQAVDLSFVGHGVLPSEHVGKATIEKLIDAIGVDVSLVVDAKCVLRQILSCVAPDLLTAFLAVVATVVPGTIQRLVRFRIVQGKALVRTCGREADDVAVRTYAAGDSRPSLIRTPGASLSG